MKTLQFLLLAFATLAASLPAAAQGRFTVSGDGQEVADKKRGVIWARCAERMEWKGKTCQGRAKQVPYPMAQARVTEVAARTGKAWRLPTIKELVALANPAEADPSANVAAIDAAVFPATPPLRFWTSSNAGPHYYMYVGFKDGEAGENSRSIPAAIRLVRDNK